MSVRGKPLCSRSLAFITALATVFALVVPLAGTALATHKLSNQDCDLEITPETDTNNTGTSHSLTAVLMAGDTGNATETAATCAGVGGHPVEVDFEIESGPGVTVTDDAGTRTSDDGNTPTTPDMTCTIAPTAESCSVSFSSSTPGTNVVRGWIDDDSDNTTGPGTTPSDADATEARNAGASDCIAPTGQPIPQDDPAACANPAPNAAGARTERDDTDVVSKTWVQAVANVCLDAEPDGDTNVAGSTHTIRARITDGSRTGDPDTGLVQDADGNRYDCTGQPLAGQTVRISITDDTPDAFIASVNGVSTGGPTFGGPNTADGQADANGFVTFTVRTVSSTATGQNAFQLTVPGSPGAADDSETVTKDWQAPVPQLDSSPETDTNEVGQVHTITATVTDQATPPNPLSGREVDAKVTGGPHADNDLDNNALTPAGYIGECTTAANGTCSLSYTGSEVGTDTIETWLDVNGNDTNDAETTDTVSKTWVAVGAGTARVRLDMEGCNGDRVPPIDESTWEDTAQPNVVNNNHQLCAERFSSTDQPQAGAVLMRITSGPGFFTSSATSTDNLGTTITAEEVGGTYAVAWLRSSTSGNTVVTAGEGTITDTGTKPWTGGDPRTIDCEPETASNEAGTEHIVTCTVKDRFGNPVSGATVNWAESGPGRFEGTPQATTGADGTAEARVTSTADERGTQTITGSLTTTVNVDECERAANDPTTGAPAGVCTDSVTKTWTEPGPAPECSDGIDNDGDGKIDLADPGCTSPEDDSEAGEEEDAATNLTIRYQKKTGDFKGAVGSDRKRCQTNRRVVLKKVVRGPNRIVGRDTSNRFGNWKIHKPRARGRFYAVARPKTFTDGTGTIVNCLRDRSVTIKVGRRR